MENLNESSKQALATNSLAEENAVAAPKPGKAKVGITFIAQDKDGDLGAACNRILAGMTANASYPSPSPTLATLTTARDAFVAAVTGNDGGAKAVVARDQARDALELVLRELAAYVQHVCLGDLLVLLSSGFPAQRQRSAAAVQPLPPPTGLKLRRGEASGQVFLRCATLPSALLYQWRYATAQAPTVWTLADTSSSVSCRLEGLVAGTSYLLQVCAYGKRGASDWSASLTYMAT